MAAAAELAALVRCWLCLLLGLPAVSGVGAERGGASVRGAGVGPGGREMRPAERGGAALPGPGAPRGAPALRGNGGLRATLRCVPRGAGRCRWARSRQPVLGGKSRERAENVVRGFVTVRSFLRRFVTVLRLLLYVKCVSKAVVRRARASSAVRRTRS